MSFRKADDLRLVEALGREIWHEYYPGILSTAQIDYMLATGYSQESLHEQVRQGVLFEIVGDDVGFLAYGPVSHDVYKLHKLYLRASTRGQGLGQRAIAHVEQSCRALGAKKLVLNVNKHNTLAMKAYQRAGYVREESVVIDIGQGYVMDDFVYAKSL